MDVKEQRQQSPVADEVEALVAVLRPLIASVLQSITSDVLEEAGIDRYDIPLKVMGRLRRESDGDSGNAFEYAIHEAMLRRDQSVVDRISSALQKCRIAGDPESIFFAMEKQGSQQLIATQIELITDESRVLSGRQGQPVKLKNYLSHLAAAFRRQNTRPNLPQSINGLWKADLFLGDTTRDHWVGTTVKINPHQLEAARGLRIAVVPSVSGRTDSIYRHEQKNLVVCPIPYDKSFMEIFRRAWRIVQALCASTFRMPSDAMLPNPVDRQAAEVFVERRNFNVEEVLDVTQTFSQPHLLTTTGEAVASSSFGTDEVPETNVMVAPVPIMTQF